MVLCFSVFHKVKRRRNIGKRIFLVNFSVENSKPFLLFGIHGSTGFHLRTYSVQNFDVGKIIHASCLEIRKPQTFPFINCFSCAHNLIICVIYVISGANMLLPLILIQRKLSMHNIMRPSMEWMIV